MFQWTDTVSYFHPLVNFNHRSIILSLSTPSSIGIYTVEQVSYIIPVVYVQLTNLPTITTSTSSSSIHVWIDWCGTLLSLLSSFGHLQSLFNHTLSTPSSIGIYMVIQVSYIIPVVHTHSLTSYSACHGEIWNQSQCFQVSRMVRTPQVIG